jgi:hypothetical protein
VLNHKQSGVGQKTCTAALRNAKHPNQEFLHPQVNGGEPWKFFQPAGELPGKRLHFAMEKSTIF